MGIHRHLGVFGIVIPQGPSTSSPYGDNSLKWLFSDQPNTMVRYFHEASGGLIDISGAECFGLVVVVNPTDGLKITQAPSRGAALNAALAVAQSMGAGNLKRFDGLVFVIMGTAVGAGAGVVEVDGKIIPSALLDDRGEYSFVQHEVGHVVGLDHSYNLGWSNPNGLFYGEYGDATDIMSALTFGSNPATFGLAHDPGSDINANAKMWTVAGPGISAATLWRYLPGFPNIAPWVHMLPIDAPPTELELRPPGSVGTTLIVKPREGGGWWAVEFRPAQGWDRGLRWDPFNPSNAPGFVIHQIRDVGNGFEHPSYPRRNQVCYRGTIPYPSRGDDDFRDDDFAVSVVAATAGGARVRVGATLPGARNVKGAVKVDSGQPVVRAFGREWYPLAGPRCEGAELDTEHGSTSARVTVQLSSTGFLNQKFSFMVNGRAITQQRAVASFPISGSDTFSAEVWIPTGTSTATKQNRNISFSWQQAGHELVLDLPAGDGTYDLSIMGTVEDGTGLRVDWSRTIDVETAYVGLTAEAAEQVEACMRYLLREITELRVPWEMRWPEALGPIDGPDWTEGLHGRRLVETLVGLWSLEQSNQRMARGVRSRIASVIGARSLADMEALRDRILSGIDRPRPYE